jgi:hypothetical protein
MAILFTLLFCFLVNAGHSQIVYSDVKKINNEKSTVSLTIYEEGNSNFFIFDFFNLSDCQKRAELIVKTKSGKIIRTNYRRFGCSKKFAGFSIDINKVRLEEIDLIRYVNLTNSSFYDFKI